jgi:hydrogenase expression/formation protein HypD
VQSFLAAGHVCAVMGYWEYEPIAEQYQIPMVVTGFEPLDLLQGITMAVAALEEGRIGIENQYSRAVTRDGNRGAQDLIRQVFAVGDRKWRGIGEIPMSGLLIRDEFESFNAELRFDVETITAEESPECIAGEILRGLKKPNECPAFGTRCNPDRPLGAPMVSAEGACAAYYQYGRTA